MKNLFTPIDFSTVETNSPAAPTDKPDPELIKKEMAEFHSEILRLINEIQLGHSELHRPVQMKGSPLFAVIDRMGAVPTKHNIHDFFEITLQDLGARFKTVCESILNNGKFPNLNKLIK